MRRLISLSISFLIVALLWYSLDARAILSAMRHARIEWVLAGLAMVVPLTAITAWRFSLLSRSDLPMRTSVRLALAASTLNLVLPSKMGDLAKAWVLHRRHGWEGDRATVLVVFEKLADMASLLAWGVLALFLEAKGVPMIAAAAALTILLAALLLVLSPAPLTAWLLRQVADRLHPKAGSVLHAVTDQWVATTRWFWADGRRARIAIVTSIGLWAGHLIQIWLFAHSLGNVPVVGSMAAGTLAILVGLLPFTIAGIGSRDAALVFLFAPWLSAPQGAALGMLATMRYLLPAITGLPFVHDFWQARQAVAISQTQRS